MARGRGVVWAIEDVFTNANFAIAVVAALIGFIVVESIRRKL
jgi:hypothetical protein